MPEAERPLDPLGARALFWSANDGARQPSEGRRAFFSAADEERSSPNPLVNHGPIVMLCSACEESRRVSLLDLVVYALPLALWRPHPRFDHYLRCPSCSRRRWMSVTYQAEV